MITLMTVVFVIGYILIAMEHKIGINKAATALILGMTLWVLYMFSGDSIISVVNAESFRHFLAWNSDVANMPLAKQCAKFVSDFQIVESLGEHVQIVLYLIGAMAIVELIDVHGGFMCVTERISTRSKRNLLWILSFITFFMSSILDNLTTAIVMTMLLRKMVSDRHERWIFAGMIIIAANSGGAWTPTGDVTTIMLWINENVTTSALITKLFLPSLLSMLVPLAIVSLMLGKGDVNYSTDRQESAISAYVSNKERVAIFCIGVSALISIPIFKAITHLPPFMGVLLVLGIIWVYMEIMYNRKPDIPISRQYRLTAIFSRIDLGTILFFMGILMAVSALQSAGILKEVSTYLDEEVHNVYVINTIVGILSSIIDNVPLVAGAMGMYPMPTHEAVALSGEAAYMANFVQDGIFWQLLAYCAGVGGSILIIGSAAGVVVMGLEKITFAWYCKHISLLALLGYFSGIITYVVQNAILG